MFLDLRLKLIGYSDIFVVLLNKLLQKYAEVVFVDIFLRAVRVFSSGAVIVDEAFVVPRLFDNFNFLLSCNICSASSAGEQPSEGEDL